jgi:hypothetical protein
MRTTQGTIEPEHGARRSAYASIRMAIEAARRLRVVRGAVYK